MVSQRLTSTGLSRPHHPIKNSTTALFTSIYSCVLHGIFPQISWLAWVVWLWGYGFVCRISSHNPLQNPPPFESTWRTPRTISCQDTQPAIKRSTHCHSYHLPKEYPTYNGGFGWARKAIRSFARVFATSRVYLIVIKGCDTKQKCQVLTKPGIKCRLVNTVPCLRTNKYNLVLIRQTFLVSFYYKLCFISYYFTLFAVTENNPHTRRVRLHDTSGIDWTDLGANIWNPCRFCRC